MYAFRGGHNGAAKQLLDHGADFSHEDNDGQNALMLALLTNNKLLANILLDKGADI